MPINYFPRNHGIGFNLFTYFSFVNIKLCFSLPFLIKMKIIKNTLSYCHVTTVIPTSKRNANNCKIIKPERNIYKYKNICKQSKKNGCSG